MINKKIIKIRKKLDKLDLEMLNLIKKRSLLVDQVIKIKHLKKQIIDKKRIKMILKNIKKKSVLKKIDPNITERIWKTMINSFIQYEFKKFKKK
jgi:chorismate mutase|tara:strand:+ start:118 stop:399 length:282 start_codon:yes stop_codon:yes gene_type:complete